MFDIVAAACGNDADGGDTSAQVSTTEHNDADVAFASEMLQHHAQALTMVDLTMGRGLDPEVKQLADDIRSAQAPEIETFTDWLTDWDEEIPSTMRDHANADHEDGEAMADVLALAKKMSALPARTKTMKELAETLKTLVALERQAYDLDVKQGGSEEETLSKLMDELSKDA